VPFWHNDSDVQLAYIACQIDYDLARIYLPPTYTEKRSGMRAPIETCDPVFYENLRQHVLEWYALRTRLEIVKWVFKVLDAPAWRPASMRYLFPGVLPLLRMVGDSNSKHASQARVLALELLEADPKAYRSPPNTETNFRQALAIANETMASLTMLSGEKFEGTSPVTVNFYNARGNKWDHPDFPQPFDVPM
jgi:hypothetical protein